MEQSRQSKPKKPSNPKKQLIVGLILFTLLFGIIGACIVYTNINDEKKETEKLAQLDGTQSTISQGKVDESKFKDLSGLNYELLLADTTILNGTENYQLNLDIQVAEKLSKEELQKLDKSAVKALKKQLAKKATVSGVNINVFTSKEAFDLTQAEDFNAIYVDGLLQKFTSKHSEETNAFNIYDYSVYKETTDLENMQSSTDFEVVNARLLSDLTTVTADVIMKPASDAEAKDMIQNLVAMLKASNDGVTDVDMYTYQTEADYTNSQYDYQLFSDENLVIHKTYGTFE